MPDVSERFAALLQTHGGDYGEAFNAASRLRGTSAAPEDVALDRYAQAADRPELALVSPIYEGLKGVEQTTGVPALSRTIDALDLPQEWKPGVGTSPASLENVVNSWRGAGARGVQEKSRVQAYLRSLLGG